MRPHEFDQRFRGLLAHELQLGSCIASLESETLGYKAEISVLRIYRDGSGWERGPRIHDQAADERIGWILEGMAVYGSASSRLAEVSEAVGIAAERLDVLMDPFETEALVEEPKVLFVRMKSGGVGKAEDVETIAEI